MFLIDETCTESCGYIAAFISMICFGSFGVPMKSETARKVDVDPLVFQSYKTLSCFLTSFIVLWLGVEKLTFTPWGIVSGLFWVPGGTAHICAIRTAGLAISQGTSSSIIVMVAFSWGIFVFNERIRSLPSALFAIFMMIFGIIGMSFFSATPSSPKMFAVDGTKESKHAIFCIPTNSPACILFNRSRQPPPAVIDSVELLDGSRHSSKILDGSRHSVLIMDGSRHSVKMMDDDSIHTWEDSSSSGSDIESTMSLETKEEKMVVPTSVSKTSTRSHLQRKNNNNNNSNNNKKTSTDHSESTKKKVIEVKKAGGKARGGAHAMVSSLAYRLKEGYGIDLTVRQMGLVVTAFGAVWGGSVMVPLHFAGKETKGLGYVFSFALGASIVNIILWILRFTYHFHRTQYSLRTAYHSLPSFHAQSIAIPGLISGILWSVGNMASILSVTYLGEGVGYSMTQSAMLISGMWGIFWFHEITDLKAIRGWMVSACFTIGGILLLSYNHLPPLPQRVLKG